MRTVSEVEAAALLLPRDDRARLAEILLASLKEEDAVPAAWLDEVERRWEEIRTGAVTTVPADEVFEELRSRRR